MNLPPIKILFILIVSFGTSYSLSAQQYQCIKANEKQYFSNINGYLRGIRIDSVRSAGTDTIYYPFKTERSDPWDTTNGSWVGSKCTQKADGTFLFENALKDTIVIQTQAQTGDQWIFYNDTGSKYFIASVVNIDTATVLGIPDSIKTIRITAFAGSTSLPTDTLSSFEIKISKYNGFVQIFDLYTFPYVNMSTGPIPSYNDAYLTIVNSPPFMSIPHGYLVSKANSMFRRTTLHNPTQMELFEFAPGDAFGRTGYNSLNPTYWNLYVSQYDSILQKIPVDPYHTTYIIDRREKITTSYYMGSTTNSYSRHIDTFRVDTSKLAIFPEEIMPEELGTFDIVYYYDPLDTSHCRTSAMYASDRPVLFEGCDDRRIYKNGFGHIDSVIYSAPWSTEIGCHGTAGMSLSFSVKGGTLCGTYNVPNTVEMITVYHNYTVYPNPANREVILSSDFIINSIVIYDILGRKKYASEPLESRVQIDISTFTPGVYFIVADGTHIGKFVKN